LHGEDRGRRREGGCSPLSFLMIGEERDASLLTSTILISRGKRGHHAAIRLLLRKIAFLSLQLGTEGGWKGKKGELSELFFSLSRGEKRGGEKKNCARPARFMTLRRDLRGEEEGGPRLLSSVCETVR